MQDERESSAIEILSFEHRQIERVLLALDNAVRTGITGVFPSPAFMTRVVEFIEQYADGRHHAKEEDVLFEEMCRHGFRRENGPIACMLKQHELGRRLTATMREWANGSPEFQARGRRQLLLSASAYVELLSNHIATEDAALFPAALVCLPRPALTKIVERYRKVDSTSAAEFQRAADRVVFFATEDAAQAVVEAQHE